jgi:hypothetical protein
VDATVIDFGVKNEFCGVVKLPAKASIQNAQNGPSTRLIKASSCLERLDASIEAEDLVYYSSYQMLTTDKNSQNY